MPSVLFVCTANQFRSPLAAACFLDCLDQDPAPGTWRVESAGTWTISDLPAAPPAVKAAERLGLSGLDAHRTRLVDQALLEQFDLILVMEIGHLEAITIEFPSVCGRLNLLSQVVDGLTYSILDPADYRKGPQELASELQALIERGMNKILDLARSLHDARRISDQGAS
jgi:protein-tyrosine phosphatase